MNSLQQQARIDAFVDASNGERPHEALAMKTAASPMCLLTRRYRG